MTSREILNLKDGEEFYVVLLSSYYQLSNPFLRHYGTIKTTNYQKPLGIFKTKLKDVKIEHKYDWSTVDAYLDTTNFEHLYWRGRFDELPNDKKITDYAQYTSDHVYCMVYDDENKKNPHEHFSNMFFTEEEARLYYNKRLKKFNKDMKTYIAHLKNEINGAKICMERAQKQIDYYENIF
jgi:hypothetical protein